nr:HNH endonuclease [uncultured Mediterranean phage uvMED]
MAQSIEERKAKAAAQTREYRKTPEYRAWREANRDHINRYKRERRLQRRLSNPDYKSVADRQIEAVRRSLATLTPSPTVAALVINQQLKHIEATLYSRQKSKLRKALIKQCQHLGHISGAAMRRRYEQFDSACAYCGHKPHNPLELEIEHVLAISAGGPHCLSNIVPACTSCNSSKRNHPWLRWFRSQPFYSVQRRRKIERILSSTPYPVKQLDLLPTWVLPSL